MKYYKSAQIISAFKFGYICSLIENEFNSTTNREQSSFEFESFHQYLQTLLLFKDDYRIIFGEEILVFPNFRNQVDIQEYLTAFFSFIKSKIGEIGKAELELAYYTGATLSLSYKNNQNDINVEKYSDVFRLLYSLSNNIKACAKVDNLISKLVAEDFYECMIARNSLFTELIGGNLSKKQLNAINYFDRIIVNKY